MVESLLTLSLVIAVLLAAMYVIPHLYRRRVTHKLRVCCEKSRSIALTFDDGPSERVTPKLMDLLDEYGCKATFFLQGEKAEQSPGIARRLVQQGHQLGHHSYTHIDSWRTTPWRAVQDMLRGQRTLEKFSTETLHFRPPYGHVTLATLITALVNRTPVSWWTVDSGDTFEELPSRPMALEVLGDSKGGVVLLHDLDRGESESHREDYLLESTRAILEFARQQKIKVVTLNQLRSVL